MKCIFKAIVVVMISMTFQQMAFASNNSAPRLISVAGDAEVRVVPDEVILTLGVETWHQDLNVAKKENDQRVKRVVGVAKSNKIEAKHIQTDYIHIEPRYKSHYERKEFIGYFVKKTIVLTLKDTSKFEQILSNVLKAGANYVHGVQFRTTELRKHRDKARSLAIRAACEKANALAKALGQKVGKPHSIHENPSGWWSWYNTSWGPRAQPTMTQNAFQNVAGRTEPGSSIALGQIKVDAKVTVSFEIE